MGISGSVYKFRHLTMSTRYNEKQTGVMIEWMVMDKESKGGFEHIKKQICTYVKRHFITKILQMSVSRNQSSLHCPDMYSLMAHLSIII